MEKELKENPIGKMIRKYNLINEHIRQDENKMRVANNGLRLFNTLVFSLQKYMDSTKREIINNKTINIEMKESQKYESQIIINKFIDEYYFTAQYRRIYFLFRGKWKNLIPAYIKSYNEAYQLIINKSKEIQLK